jgi:hypothetical protein
MKTIVRCVVWLASWLLWVTAVVVGLPALLGIHIASVLGDLADDLWEIKL